MKQNSGERIKYLIAKFVLKYNYWGYLFSRIRRKPAKNFGSIMGVTPELDGTISLLYEPDLVEKTDDKNILRIIEHEGMHILNKHITRLIRILANETIEKRKKIKANAWNIAADCSVNSQANLREPFIIAGEPWPAQLPEMYKMEEGKVTEEYYLNLLQNHKKNMQQMCKKCKFGDGKGGPGEECPGDPNGNCMGKSGLDDHSGWVKGTKGVADLSALSRKIDQHIQNIVKESVKSFNKDRGAIPSHISELIQNALAPPKAPYYQIIRKLIRGSRFSKFRRSPTKINRKRTYVFTLKDDKCIPQISPFQER